MKKIDESTFGLVCYICAIVEVIVVFGLLALWAGEPMPSTVLVPVIAISLKALVMTIVGVVATIDCCFVHTDR